MKTPIRPSISARVRPATGVPTATSSCPEWRASRAEKPAIVWESDPLPNEVIVVRRGLDDALAAKLQATLSDLSDADKKLLPWPYTGFVPGTYEPYRVLEQMGRELGVIKTS